MFTKDFFIKHQNKLLWLLNFPFIKVWFRWILRIRRYDCKLNEKIIAILPNAYWVRVGGSFRADFRGHNKFGRRLYYAFKPMWWTMHFWDWVLADRFLPRLSLGFIELTAFPAAGANEPVDGRVNNNSDEDFATKRNDTIGDAGQVTETIVQWSSIETSATLGNVFDIFRGFLLFDTSALTASANISAAVLSIKGTSKNDPATAISPDIDIYTSTPASTSDIVDEDYDQVGSTSQTGSAISFASWSTSAYNDFTFNATGRGNVSKTSISQFGTRNATHDVGNSNPDTEVNNSHNLLGNAADAAGTSDDPKLVITYSLAGAYASNPIMLKVG